MVEGLQHAILCCSTCVGMGLDTTRQAWQMIFPKDSTSTTHVWLIAWLDNSPFRVGFSVPPLQTWAGSVTTLANTAGQWKWHGMASLAKPERQYDFCQPLFWDSCSWNQSTMCWGGPGKAMCTCPADNPSQAPVDSQHQLPDKWVSEVFPGPPLIFRLRPCPWDHSPWNMLGLNSWPPEAESGNNEDCCFKSLFWRWLIVQKSYIIKP